MFRSLQPLLRSHNETFCTATLHKYILLFLFLFNSQVLDTTKALAGRLVHERTRLRRDLQSTAVQRDTLLEKVELLEKKLSIANDAKRKADTNNRRLTLEVRTLDHRFNQVSIHSSIDRANIMSATC